MTTLKNINGKSFNGNRKHQKNRIRIVRRYMSGDFGDPHKPKGILAKNQTQQRFIQEALKGIENVYIESSDLKQL